MAITFDQFFQSIVQQESGGNYSALGVWLNMSYGRDRAYGKYQVMGNNVPGWTSRYYGKRLTPEQFLNNRAAQDAVARGELKRLWDAHGARGAAAAWYSGNPKLHMNTSSQSGGPSIKDYVDSVISRAGGLPASGDSNATSTSSGGGGSSVAEATSLSGAELAETYGYVEQIFNSVPELKKLFQRAVSGQWTASKFQAEIRDTNWWKSKPESVRKFLVEQSGDPATAKQKIDQQIVKVTQMAAAFGAPTDSKIMRQFAIDSLMNGWTDGQMRWSLAKKITLKGDTRTGEAGENYDKLASYAYEMGIKMSDWWLGEASRKIVGGISTYQDFEDEIRRNAKATYSGWAKQIDSGQTVADLASPYFQSMSQILELPQGSVNLFDPLIKKALQAKGSDGKAMIKPMWQFENELRSDPRWRQTRNAQNSTMQITRQVLSDFGFVY